MRGTVCAVNFLWIIILVIGLGCDSGTRKLEDKQAKKELKFVDSSTGLPTSGQWRHSMTFFDINGDGYMDILAPPPRLASEGFKRPVVWYGNGKGKWSKSLLDVPPDTDYDYGGITVGDFDGNGIADVALAMHGIGVKAFRGKGRGKYVNFSDGIPSVREFSSRALVSADFNNDGISEIAAVSEAQFGKEFPTPTGVWVCYNSNNRWRCKPIGEKEEMAALFADQVVVGDINGDGNKDIAVASHVTFKDLIVWVGDGKGGFTLFKKGLPPQGKHIYGSVAIADINRDGRDDLIVCMIGVGQKGFSGLRAFLGGPDSFKEISEGLPSPRVFYAVDASDLDGDGSVEIVAGTEEGGLRIFSYNGSRWDEVSVSGLPTKGLLRTWGIYCVDLNGDGRKDIAVNYGSDVSGVGGVRVFLNAPGKD